MEVISEGEVFVFSETAVSNCAQLQLLREQFGTKQELYNLTKQDVECLYNTLVKGIVPSIDSFKLMDFMCVNPYALKSFLQPIYDEFVYIVGEHTSLVPTTEVDINNEEIQELRVLFPEKYEVIEFVLTHKLYFCIFEECVLWMPYNRLFDDAVDEIEYREDAFMLALNFVPDTGNTVMLKINKLEDIPLLPQLEDDRDVVQHSLRRRIRFDEYGYRGEDFEGYMEHFYLIAADLGLYK